MNTYWQEKAFFFLIDVNGWVLMGQNAEAQEPGVC